MYRLDVRGLTYRVGGKTIVDHVDLSLKSGELVALLGPSGSGKSTLLTSMIGFRPGDGQVRLCGQDLYAQMNELKTLLGFVPQDDVVHRSLTVQQTLDYAAQLRLPKEMPETSRTAMVRSVLAAVELSDRTDVRVRNLSGGQRKRVSIAVELLAKPPLLFLDEPTSGLDPALEEKTMHLFRSLAEDRIVVVTTHALASLDVCDLVIILCAGKLLYVGPPNTAPEFFEVADIPSIYRVLAKTEAKVWANKFRQSSAHQNYVVDRLASPPPPLPSKRGGAQPRITAPRPVAKAAPVEDAASVNKPVPGAKAKLSPQEELARLKAQRAGQAGQAGPAGVKDTES